LTIDAHEGSIQALVFNKSASMLLSSQDNGNKQKFFNAKTGQKIKEVYRGSEPALISSMAFSMCDRFVAVASSK
jgi:WD40 repeat protein